MPYIKSKDRVKFQKNIDELTNLFIESDIQAGEVNYVLSKIIWNLFNRKKKYDTACKLCGVLSNVKDEFYRRQVIPYEDFKIHEEGDI